VNLFLLNLVLALVWAAVTGRFTLSNLLLGFGLGYLILWFGQGALGPSNYTRKVSQVASFVLFFGRELIRANLRVAYDIVTPRHHMVAVPLDAETDAEITLLANLITMTPGSLSLDVSDDRRVLYVHSMFVDDVDAFRREIKQGFERRLLEVMR
jgi:multicomponent Na+:H+ antiporter subunit E